LLEYRTGPGKAAVPSFAPLGPLPASNRCCHKIGLMNGNPDKFFATLVPPVIDIADPHQLGILSAGKREFRNSLRGPLARCASGTILGSTIRIQLAANDLGRNPSAS
jgi:hypothetical protein